MDFQYTSVIIVHLRWPRKLPPNDPTFKHAPPKAPTQAWRVWETSHNEHQMDQSHDDTLDAVISHHLNDSVFTMAASSSLSNALLEFEQIPRASGQSGWIDTPLSLFIWPRSKHACSSRDRSHFYHKPSSGSISTVSAPRVKLGRHLYD